MCTANFIPPANGASQGYYFLPKSHKLVIFEAKMSLQKKFQGDQTAEILRQNVAVLALGPSPTGHFTKNKKF